MKYPNKITKLFLFILMVVNPVYSQIEKAELVPQIGHARQIQYAEFSPDNKVLAVFSEDSFTIKLWDTATGILLREYTSEDHPVSSLKFTPDGKKLAVIYNIGMKAELLSVITGKVLKTFEGSESNLYMDFSPTGKYLLSRKTVDDSATIEIWDVETKRKSGILAGNFSGTAAFTPDEKMVALSEENGIGLWNIAARKKIRQITEASDQIISMAFSPDGKYFVNSTGDSINYWDMLLQTIVKPATEEPIPVIRDENKTYVIDKVGEIVRILEVGSTENLENLLSTFSEGSGYFPYALSSDGKILAALNEYGRTMKLWDVNSGKETITLPDKLFHYSVAISPDGSTLAIGNFEGTINLWDIRSGTNPRSLSAHSYFVEIVAFSKDGKTLASAADDATIKLWDLASGKKLNTLQRQSSAYEEIPSVLPGFPEKRSNSSDNFTFITEGTGLVKISDKKSGKELASLVVFNDIDWMVTTPEGLFDGTPNAWKQLIWRFNNDTFNYAPVEAFFNEFYYPGLLQEIIAGKKPKPPAKNLASIDIRQPQVEFVEIGGQAAKIGGTQTTNKRNFTLKIAVTDNNNKASRPNHPTSSGANDLRIFRNGSLIKQYKKNVFALTEDDGCLQTSATAGSPGKVTCYLDVPIIAGDNNFTAYVFNHDNVKSADARMLVKGEKSLEKPGTLYVLALGVNKYASSSFNLKYAVADVEAIGDRIRLEQTKFPQKPYAETKVIKLTDENATKDNIVTALKMFSGTAEPNPKLPPELQQIKQIQPEDGLIIYFAGHGLADKDRFYLIPHDGIPVNFAGKITPDVEEQKRLLLQGKSVSDQKGMEQLFRQSISDLELEDLLETVNAGKLMMVIDACNSGQALEAEEKRRGPMNSRGLAQLAYEKGMNILTASQSFQAALEVTKLNHGLLTYALLEGLKKGDSNNDRSIIDREWLDYGVTAVPQLQIEALNKRLLTQNKETAVSEKDGKSELQMPRVFYRREVDSRPLVIALPE